MSERLFDFLPRTTDILPAHDLCFGTPVSDQSAGIPLGDGDTASLLKTTTQCEDGDLTGQSSMPKRLKRQRVLFTTTFRIFWDGEQCSTVKTAPREHSLQWQCIAAIAQAATRAFSEKRFFPLWKPLENTRGEPCKIVLPKWIKASELEISIWDGDTALEPKYFVSSDGRTVEAELSAGQRVSFSKGGKPKVYPERNPNRECKVCGNARLGSPSIPGKSAKEK